MANYNVPKIESEDLRLMEKIAKHGFVDMQYIHRFYKVNSKPRTVEGRINQLIKHNYLDELRTFVPPEYTSMLKKSSYRIICLAKKGLQLMEFYDAEIDDKTSILKNASPYRMYHQVQVATVCDTIEECFKNSDSIFCVDSILNEKEVFIDETRNMPDALILFRYKDITNGHGLVAVFIEIERSYTSLKRIENKLRRYSQSFSDNIYSSKLKIPIMSYRTLFVAQTKGQFTGIEKKIKATTYAKELDVLLAGYQDICNHTLDSIYTVPMVDKNIKLLGKIEIEDISNVAVTGT